MRKSVLISIFWGLLILWGYQFPYQWWLKYGHSDAGDQELTNNYLNMEKEPALPEPFWGASLTPVATPTPTLNKNAAATSTPTVDLAGPVLDEIKVCFGDGPLSNLSSSGDLSMLVMSLQNQLGPVQDDLLLEKKVVLKMKDGRMRTLVYEWISQEEGSDVYWHESDEEGFPRPVDLPDGSGRDIAAFEKLKQQGSPSKSAETRLIQLQNGMQMGVESIDGAIQSLSVKDEGHLVKCRRDPVKSFVCDCLN